MQIVVADFEGLWDRTRSKKPRKLWILLPLLSLPSLFFGVKPEYILVFILISMLTIAIMIRCKGRKQMKNKEKKLKIMSFSKDDLKNPEDIAIKLLDLAPFHKARNPAVYVIVCELSSTTAPYLKKLAKCIKSMLRKNDAKLVLYTYPSLNVIEKPDFCQIIFYDGSTDKALWSEKLDTLRKAIEYCSEGLTYEQEGVAAICYNSFTVPSNLSYDQLKFELMTVGIPLFSNLQPFIEKGEEIIYCICPERLKSEIEKISHSLSRKINIITGNSNAVEIFTIYHVKDWNDIVDALMMKKDEDENAESDWIKELKNSVEGYVVTIIEPESEIPFQIDKKMFDEVKKLRTIPKHERAKALFDYLISKVQYKKSRRYRTSREVFYEKGGICGELSFLYTVLARAIGLKSGIVDVKVDVNGKSVNHACSWVKINGKELLVDLAYGVYDIKHKKFKKLSDREVVQLFKSWRYIKDDKMK